MTRTLLSAVGLLAALTTTAHAGTVELIGTDSNRGQVKGVPLGGDATFAAVINTSAGEDAAITFESSIGQIISATSPGDPTVTCEITAGKATCHQQQPGQSIILATVERPPLGELSMTATVTSENAIASAVAVESVLPVADVQFSVSASTLKPVVGSRMSFTMTAFNAGPAAADLLTVEAFPFETEDPGAIAFDAGRWQCEGVESGAACTLDRLELGESASFTITVDVPALKQVCGFFTQFTTSVASLDPTDIATQVCLKMAPSNVSHDADLELLDEPGDEAIDEGGCNAGGSAGWLAIGLGVMFARRRRGTLVK